MPTAFIFINTEIGSEDTIFKVLRNIDGVIEAHITYGIYDIICKLEKPDMESLKEAIENEIRSLDQIRSSLTMLVAGTTPEKVSPKTLSQIPQAENIQ